MKLRVERDALADAVTWAARALPSRPPVPVLAGLLLEASATGELSLSSFDYEVSAHVDTEADVADAGRVLVSGRLLADIARSLPNRPVDISLDGSKVAIVCGSSRFSLLTLPIEDYPALPDMPTRSGTLASDAFAAAVAKVTVAAGRDDTLPVLTGVRMELRENTVTLAATDRYRLAACEVPWVCDTPGLEVDVLVPAKTLSDTAKALGGYESVTVAVSSGGAGEGLVGFEAGRRRTTSRLLDGEFPKYRSLWPAEVLSAATIDAAVFVEAVKRVAIVADRNSPIRLIFTEGGVTLEAGSGEEAQASEALDASFSGDDVTIAFNPSYLLDGLQALGAGFARLSFTTPTKPAALTRVAEVDAPTPEDYRYQLMPVRLAGSV